MPIKGDLQKHTLHLREGDWAYLEAIYRPKGIATSLAIRTVVANFVDAQRKKEAPRDPLSLDVEI
jgi:hypothetical protein